MPADEYGPVGARYYDAAYAHLRHDAGDIAFYRALARETGGPVLELGCGTGRVLLAIAHDGVPAVGLDLSAAMLDELRAKAPPTGVELVCASMTAFDLGAARFPFIYSAFRALQHVCTVEEQLACLARVRRHVAPRGRFAFDVFAPDYERLGSPPEVEEEDVRFDRDGITVRRMVTVERDVATQMLSVHFRFLRSRGGASLGEEAQTFHMRWYHRYEVEHLLARAGFTIERLHGGFDGRPYDGHGDLVVVARPG